jgi:hypothetical protein
MTPPRVLVVLKTDAAWSRGILRGVVKSAHERGWTLLHYLPPADPDWVKGEWKPEAAVLGPEVEERIATLAAEHLLATGLRQVSTFRYDESAFAVRAGKRVRRAGRRVRTTLDRGARDRRRARREGRRVDSRGGRSSPHRPDGGQSRGERSTAPRATLSRGIGSNRAGRDPPRPRRGRAQAPRRDSRKHRRSRATKRLHERRAPQRRLSARARHAAERVPAARARSSGRR